MISEVAVSAAYAALFPEDETPKGFGLSVWVPIITAVLEAAAPHMAAQALRDAVDAFPLETITAPDNAVVWMMRRADGLDHQAERA